jgi:predicted DNA-binding transcriptional regulator AlpA/SAM-dependent methyltransferase
MSEEALISLADLADMAGVSRPAVSNWRRRNDDFPSPVKETGATSLFRLAELQAWMRSHGKRFKAPSVDQLVWSALNRMRGQVLPEEAAEAAMILLGYMALASRLGESDQTELRSAAGLDLDALNRYLLHLSREAWRIGLGDILVPEAELPWWWDQSRSFLIETVELAAAFGVSEVFEALIAAAARGSRGAGEHATPSSVADLMVALADPIRGVVFDPACGHGTLLLAADREAKAPLTLIGQEINPTVRRIARLRMFVHGLDAEVVRGDTLRDDGPEQTAKVDLVLADPPFGPSWRPEEARMPLKLRFGVPPASRAELAWLQDGIARLRPGGLAIYVFPAGPLFRAGIERDIRCRLIEAHAIQAIVALPPSLYPSTNIPVALWIAGRPGERDDDQVLLIDASKLGVRRRSRTELTEADIIAIESCFRAWQARNELPSIEEVQTAMVSSERLLENDGILNPSRWVNQAVESPLRRLERIGNALRDLDTAKNAFSLTLPFIPDLEPAYGDTLDRHQTFRLGEVARIIRPRRIDPEAIGTGAASLIRLKDINPDMAVFPGDSVDIKALTSPVELTQPGDVVVMADGAKPRAAVDHAGGAVVGAPLQIVRPQRDFLDPTVLAALITLFAPRYAVGSSVKYVDLPAMELPYPDAEVAHVLRQALQALGKERRRAVAAVKAIDELRDVLVDGLCSGTLKPSYDVFDEEEP